MNTFSPSVCIRFGWKTFKKRPWFFVGVFFLVTVLSATLQSQDNTNTNYAPAAIAALVLVGLILAGIQILVKMGTIHFTLKAHDDAAKALLLDLWAPRPFWSYVGAGILVALIVIVGLILLIVPGIIWALRYMFVPYLVMDRKLKPFEALSESARITHGHKWQLLGLFGLIALVNILGFLALIVGLLVSIPVTTLAFAHAYRTLSKTAATQ